MKLINQRNGDIIADRIEIANGFLTRLAGLMGRTGMPENSALVLNPCSSIHTFFMRFCIDAVFLDGQGEVVHMIAEMPTYGISPMVKKAKMVIELPGGTAKNRVYPGDILKIER
ncbi:MAG: hypothetical protein VR68_08590 [Peptococcaceae bacterium BRH_c4a]|nr:MAG: hypothetical protein VR68_08590 [Peptococcaceae bacterium BRH_c4a]